MPELSEKLCFTLNQELGGEEGAVPEEVQVLPSGKVDPKGKTSFLVDEEARRLIIAAFDESKTDLVVDYEHQSLSGSEAPAAGWIKDLEDRGEEGVWGKVRWTERAREYLRNREYRYLSPVILIRKKDGRAVELLGAALTNMPAIEGMAPVVNTGRPDGREEVMRMDEDYKEMYFEVLKLVGLPEDAGLEDLRARVATMSDPAGFVPASEYEALKATLKAREADALISEALSAGKITPSLLPWAREYAAVDPEGFREFLGKACPVVPFKHLDTRQALSIDPAQREVNSLLGIGDELYLKRLS